MIISQSSNWLFQSVSSFVWSHRFTSTAAAAVTAALLGLGWSACDCDPSLYVRQRFIAATTTRYENTISSTHTRTRTRTSTFFQGKTLWIIGASSGIGEELALQLSAMGNFHTLYLSSRSTDRLDRVAQKCRERLSATLNHRSSDSVRDRDDDDDANPSCCSNRVVVVPMDVSNFDSMTNAVQTIAKNTNGVSGSRRLDMVFLNAGRGHLSPMLEMLPDLTRAVLEQTAVWPMLLTPLLLPLFENDGGSGSGSGQPHLVVTSSIAAFLPIPLSAVYAGSKHALQGYFSSIQAEGYPPNLRVDMICPGPVDTHFHHQHHHHQQHPQEETTTTRTADTLEQARNSNKKSPLKMSVSRCAELMLCAVAWPSRNGRTVYLCPQPTLSLVYLSQLLPKPWVAAILRRVGSRRLELWKEGLDLYDPSSWKTKRK